jgi:hypothetical protein
LCSPVCIIDGNRETAEEDFYVHKEKPLAWTSCVYPAYTSRSGYKPVR